MSPIPLIEAVDESCYGGKAVKLGEALRAGLPVPGGFALDTDLVESVRAGGYAARRAVIDAFETLGGAVAVRSSAVGEDSADASFAGQHLTVLNVTSAAGVIEAVARVRDSAHDAAARAYRKRRGLQDAPRVGVVMQRLIDADTAGVLFTRNPLTGRDERVIEAAWGLGEVVVAGLVTPDAYRVSRSGALLGVEPGDKPLALHPVPDGGTREEELDPVRAAALTLAPREVALLHDLASRAEAVYGRDLDIEWAIVAGRVYLLQCRAITMLPVKAVA